MTSRRGSRGDFGSLVDPLCCPCFLCRRRGASAFRRHCPIGEGRRRFAAARQEDHGEARSRDKARANARMSGLKVAYVTESLLPHVDGVSRTLAQLFSFLEGEGVDFRVFAPFAPGPEVSWHARVHRVPYVRVPFRPEYRMTLPVGHRASQRLDEYGPDLIHVVSPTPVGVRAQKYGQRHGIPVVGSFHTHFVSYFRFYGLRRIEWFGWRLMRSFYGRCEVVYAPSHGIIHELAERGIANTELWSR